MPDQVRRFSAAAGVALCLCPAPGAVEKFYLGYLTAPRDCLFRLLSLFLNKVFSATQPGKLLCVSRNRCYTLCLLCPIPGESLIGDTILWGPAEALALPARGFLQHPIHDCAKPAFAGNTVKEGKWGLSRRRTQHGEMREWGSVFCFFMEKRREDKKHRLGRGPGEVGGCGQH